jgi:hypothetical protein
MPASAQAVAVIVAVLVRLPHMAFAADLILITPPPGKSHTHGVGPTLTVSGSAHA